MLLSLNVSQIRVTSSALIKLFHRRPRFHSHEIKHTALGSCVSVFLNFVRCREGERTTESTKIILQYISRLYSINYFSPNTIYIF
jgi:hypothetical protein